MRVCIRVCTYVRVILRILSHLTYYRMCFLTMECALLLEGVYACALTGESFYGCCPT